MHNSAGAPYPQTSAYPPTGAVYNAPPAAAYPPPISYQNPLDAPPPSYAKATNENARNAIAAPVVSAAVYDSEAPSFAGPGFSEKAIRLRFIRKVYLILTAQLFVTLAFICFFLFHKPTQKWVHNNIWFYFIAYGVFLVTYITIVCCKNVRRKSPGNYICLIAFTLAFSLMAATISSYHEIEAVLIAMGITCGVCVGVTLFSIQTKVDFTRCTGLLFCLLLVLLLFGLACIIVFATTNTDERTARILQCVYGCLGALVFSLFLAYDTQMIVGGRKHEYSEEDYICAAVQIYLDVVYIFLFLLSAVGGGSN